MLITSAAFAQPVTNPRLVVLSMGKRSHPVTLADNAQRNAEFRAEIQNFKNVGTGQALRNEVAEMIRLGAVTPFEEIVFIMDTQAFWKTKYSIKKIDKFCMKVFENCLKDIFEHNEHTNVNEVISYIRSHKQELYKKVDKNLLEQQRLNKSKMDAVIGIFTQN